MTQKIIETVSDRFKKRFQTEPLLVRSPGRVNLIGEHTDYNEGFVLPAAVDRAIVFAVSPNNLDLIRILSVDMEEEIEVQNTHLKKNNPQWSHYLLGVIDQLNQQGLKVPGFDCVFGGNIPIGAGMSSSAAIEAGLAFSLNTLFEWDLAPLDLVKLSQKAENEFVGVQCGIMDQFTNIFAEPQKVVKLDCRSLEHEYYPFEFKGVCLVLYDTRVSHSLASSEYNRRRNQCEEGVRFLKQHHPHIRSLRDITSEMLNSSKTRMDPVLYKRCHYVVEENERLLSACRDLEIRDLESFGNKMYQTHYGLQKEYEVSCPELDFLVEYTRNQSGVLGSRMMGGGFGGCTINLIKQDELKELNEQISQAYSHEYKKKPGIYKVKIEKGTHVI
ncbi:MAG: galactokinase [Candidatus Aminicenantes bacterium]|nr:galactokinase [Candidatus Aminicenantes bacterium]